MKFKMIPVAFLILTVFAFPGCAKKADPQKPIEKIQKEAATMSVKDLESSAMLYASAIRAQKAEIMKIQDQIKKMPVEKFFQDKSLNREIATIGQRAEALFDRYRVYVQALQDKGGDLSKVQIEPRQHTNGDEA